MKFTTTQKDLNFHLNLVARAIPARPTHPVLANVKLEASNDKIELTGFDLSLGIQTSFTAQVIEPGILTLPAKLLTDIVAKLPSGDITIDDDAGECLINIKSVSGKYQVRGMTAEEYPDLPSIEDGEINPLSATAFIEGLKGSLVACSQDETKQILTGVYLKVKPDCLEFAATDGHRLGMVVVYPEGDDTNGKGFEVTVPAKALRELEKMLGTKHYGDKLGIQLEQGQVVFGWGEQKLTIRTLEGKYPDYQLLLPKQFQRKITLDRKQLIGALERIATIADPNTGIVKFSIDSAKQSIALSVEVQDRGNGRESFTAQIYGADLDIAFNIKYLMDGLKTISTTEIVININGALEPVTLTPVGGIEMVYLVMPVQIRG